MTDLNTNENTNNDMTLEESIIYLSDYLGLKPSEQETNDCVERYEQAETAEDEQDETDEGLTLADELRGLYDTNNSFITDNRNYIPRYQNGEEITQQDIAEFNNEAIERISKILCIELEQKVKWVKIEDFENYSISEYGDIRNDLTDRILKGYISKNKFVQYKLYKKGKQFNVYSHRLTAQHFINKVEDKNEVSHIDGDKRNNHFKNLKWVKGKDTISKEVAQFDIQGDLLGVFCSTMEVERQTGVASPHISECCRGLRSTAGGFIWKYTN